MTVPDQPDQASGAGEGRVPGDLPMSLSDHLEALRGALLRGGKWLLLGFLLCFLVSDTLLWIVVRPHRLAMEALGEPATLAVLRYQDTFLAHLKLALYGGLFIGLPMILRSLWQFVAVGLYVREQRLVRLLTPLVMGCFTVGVLFGYFVMVPLALRFLAAYGDREALVNTINLSDYISLVLLLTLVMGLVFQLPLIMWCLVRLGITTPAQFARVRRYAIFAAVVVAAILTPPDVITQLLMAGPLVILYELGILLTGGRAHTLLGGRFLYVGLGVLVAAAIYLGWDLYRVDRALAGLEPTQLVWTGGGDRPYEVEAHAEALSLLELEDRALLPAVARARQDPAVIPLAAELATRSEHPGAARDALLEWASDPRDLVRDRVARALGRTGNPEDVEVLEQLRTDRDRAVAVSAATALLRCGVHTGAFTLLRTLEQGPPALEEAAREALVEARGEDPGSLEGWYRWYRSTLAGEPLGSHRALVELLEELQAAGEALPEEVCRQLVGSTDPYVRFRAAALAPSRMVQRLAGDPDPTVRLEAGRTLARRHDYAGIPVLLGLVGDRQLAVSRLATVALREATGLDLPEERAAWEAWWRDAEATFKFPGR